MKRQKRILSACLAMLMIFCSFGTMLPTQAAVTDENRTEIVNMLKFAYETKSSDDSVMRFITTVDEKYVNEIDEIRFYLSNGDVVSTTDAYTSLTDNAGGVLRASDYGSDYIAVKVVRDMVLPVYVTVKAVIDGEEIEGPTNKIGTGIAKEDDDAIRTNAQNVDNVLSTLEYDSTVVSTNSTQSLKLGIDGGRGETWANVDLFISELVGWQPVDLVGKTITFDVKPENSSSFFGIAAERSGYKLSDMIYVGYNSSDSAKGWSCQETENGWYKVTIDMDKAFGGYQDRVFKLRIMISNSGADQNAVTSTYIDNLYLGTEISGLVVGAGNETGDSVYAKKVIVDSVLNFVGDETYETSLYSTQAMRMSIDPNRGDVWGCGDLVVNSLLDGEDVILSGKTITFDMKVSNTLNSVRFQINTPGVGWSSEDLWISCGGSGNGWSTSEIGNGWYRLTIDMDKCFGDHAKAIAQFRFMMSNSGQDQTKISNLYIDNVMLGELVTYVSNEEEDAIHCDVQNVDSVLNTVTYDETVLSTNSTQSLKLGINGGRGTVWANADVFVSELIGWKPVDLVGKTITFDVKAENSAGYVGVVAERSDVGLAEMIYVGFGSSDDGKGWKCSQKENGWYKVTIDMGKAFGGYQDRVFKIRILIANDGANTDADTAVYIDNLYLGTPISELKEGIRSEANDAINVDCQDGGNLNTVAYSTENFSLYSLHSLKLGIDGGRGEVWASGDIMIAALNQWNGVNLSGKTIEFDVKPVNSQTFFALSAEQQGVGLAEFIYIGFDSADDAKGWSCRPTGAGWYRVIVDMDKAFPNYTTSVFKFRVMINNQNQDQSQPTAVYIDNLDIDFAANYIDAVHMWKAENTESVMQSASKPSGATTDLNVEGIKGETESVQLIIRPDNAVSAYRVTASELTDGNGNVIDASNVEILSQHYIQTTSPSQDAPTTASMETGWYPDALIPIDVRIKAGENTIAGGTNQGFWINVDIPSDVPAGTYTGVIKVLLDTKYCELPLTVQVHNLTMPETMHNQLAFGLWYNYIDEFGEYESVDNTLYENYYNFLVDKRVTPYDIPTKGYSSASEYADYLVQYAKNPRVSSYNLPYKAVEKKFLLWTYNVIDKDYMIEILTAMAKKNKELWDSGDHETDLFEKAIVYAWEITDEPTDGKAYQIKQCDVNVTEAKNAVKALLEGYPELQESLMNIKHVVTRQEYSTDFEGDDENGGIQTWCLYVNQYEASGFADIMEERRNNTGRVNGEDFWWYHCQDPGNPYPSFFIDDNLISTRTITWMQKHYDVTGYLEWCVNFWQKNTGSAYERRDIWSDPASYNGKNGDGQLIYSGSKYGLNEPISTLRLESTREANEDYEYLWMFEKRIAELNAEYGKFYDSDTILNTFYTRIFTGTKPKTDVSEFKAVRSELLELLDDMYNNPSAAITKLDTY